jgi:hypothetical protein
MTRADLARRLGLNLAGLCSSLALSWIAFWFLGDRWFALVAAILASAVVWSVVDYLLGRTPREQRSTIELSTFTRDGARYLQVLPGNGRRYTTLLEGAALEQFRQVAAAAGASVRPDVLAFAKILEHGAGLADGLGLTREVDPKAVAENLETIRSIVRTLSVEADEMAGDYQHGFVLSFLRRAEEVSKGAHELGTAALLLHLKAVEARANLFLQNRDR